MSMSFDPSPPCSLLPIPCSKHALQRAADLGRLIKAEPLHAETAARAISQDKLSARAQRLQQQQQRSRNRMQRAALTTTQAVASLLNRPTYATQNMAAFGRRLSAGVTALQRLTGPYQFALKLQSRALSHATTTFTVCHEAYSTQTCAHCLNLNHVGGARVYRCNHCHAVLNRDQAASTNIARAELLLAAKYFPFLPQQFTPTAPSTPCSQCWVGKGSREYVLPVPGMSCWLARHVTHAFGVLCCCCSCCCSCWGFSPYVVWFFSVVAALPLVLVPGIVQQGAAPADGP